MRAEKLAEPVPLDVIITSIYDEVSQASVWPRTLSLLRGELGAQTLVLQMAPEDAPERASFVATGKRTTTEHIAEWEQRSRDQLISLALTPGRIDVCNDYYARRPHEGFLELISRYDVARGMSTDLARLGQANYSLHALRSRRQAPFGGAETALMATVAPHFSRAIRLREALATERSNGEFEASDRFGVGMITIDPSGFARAWNAHAGAMLAGQAIEIRRGRIYASDQSYDRKLQRALSSVLGDELTRRDRVGVALAENLHAVIHSAELTEPVTRRPRRGAMVLVRATSPNASRLAARLREIFGLTAVEAEIAAYLVSGLNPAAIQMQMSIRYTTLRTHISSLFVKLDCNRQTELVRLLTACLPLLN